MTPRKMQKNRIFLPRRSFESTASLANEVKNAENIGNFLFTTMGSPSQNFCTPKNGNIWGCFNLLLT